MNSLLCPMPPFTVEHNSQRRIGLTSASLDEHEKGTTTNLRVADELSEGIANTEIVKTKDDVIKSLKEGKNQISILHK